MACFLHFKNCFIFYNDEKINFDYDKKNSKNFSYNELAELGFYPSGLDVDQVFKIQNASHADGRTILKAYAESDEVQMVAFFYQNSNQTYSLVFACGFDDELSERIETVTDEVFVKRMFYDIKENLSYSQDEEEQTQSFNSI